MKDTQSTHDVLLVDDDPVSIRIYRDGLTRRGFKVTTANDGLAALRLLRESRFEVVVLDLMMPKLSGVEVLKFLRSHKDLESLPVIVLSNAYMDSLARDASTLNVQRALLKIKCNADSLAQAIREVVQGKTAVEDIDQMLAAPGEPPRSQQAAEVTPPRPDEPAAEEPHRAEPSPGMVRSNPSLDTKDVARQELALASERTGRQLQDALDSFVETRELLERQLRLEDLCRKVHFITGLAGLAEYSGVAQMASALEALLFGVKDKLPETQPSMQRTMAMAVGFLRQLLILPGALVASQPSTPAILVVDDDRISTRLVVSALRNAQLQARGTESPELALQWLKEKHYDLVLLDIEMPGMDGIELCRRLRALPGYEKTPVIYVTFHSDFDSHAKASLRGGDDLIAKPVVPAELAVKAVMHLLRSRLPPAGP